MIIRPPAPQRQLHRRGPIEGALFTLWADGDGREDIVGIMRLLGVLLGADQRLNGLVSVLRARVFGSVAIRDEIMRAINLWKHTE